MFIKIFAYAALMSLVCIGLSKAECNVCQTNNVACVNSTSFYICFQDNVPNTNQLFHCLEGLQCTSFAAICLQASNMRPPSCGDTSLCGMCSANRNYIFACLSRTTFQMCNGAVHPVGTIGFCPDNYICDANDDRICVAESEAPTITCDIVNTLPRPGDTTATTTTLTSTTESISTSTTQKQPMTANEICQNVNQRGLYPPIPEDPYCQRYVYCYYDNLNANVINGTLYTCPTRSYFSIERSACVSQKPSYCL